jgi:hypothetical protein
MCSEWSSKPSLWVLRGEIGESSPDSEMQSLRRSNFSLRSTFLSFNQAFLSDSDLANRRQIEQARPRLLRRLALHLPY